MRTHALARQQKNTQLFYSDLNHELALTGTLVSPGHPGGGGGMYEVRCVAFCTVFCIVFDTIKTTGNTAKRVDIAVL